MPLLRPPLAIRLADPGDAHERSRIEGFVRAHPHGTPFHLPQWSDAVASACGQRAYTLIAERADGGLVAMLPLMAISSPLFGKALVSNGFATGGGILAESDDAVASLADSAWALAIKLGCPTCEMRGGPLPEDWEIDDHTYLNFSRPIAASDEAELAAIPRKQRAEVRKALGNALEIHVGSSADDAREHYRIYAESVRNLGTPVFPRALFVQILQAFGGDADILTIRTPGGAAVASVLTLYMNATAYPYWGGGTHAARELRANDAMYFALMQHSRARACETFDFGRSKAGTGAAAFKKNWGFEAVPLSYAKRAPEGQAPRDINPLSARYRLQVAAWKRLPLWVANRLGPVISRGLG
jgi:FemAB-related protein (PEP-CTERM system-associated)